MNIRRTKYGAYALLCGIIIFPSSVLADEWHSDLPQSTYLNAYKGQFIPVDGEGVRQLVLKLGDTTNQVESVIGSYATLAKIEKAEAHCPTILYESDFGTTGTIIDKPGYYMLCDDIQFGGIGNAITITSSHVTINLNSHAIYGTGSATNGIYIDSTTSPLHNIIIKNGTLSNFTANGLEIFSTSVPGFSNLVLDNVTFENTNQSGFYLNGTSGSEISNCTISNCRSTNAVAGANFKFCTDVNVDKSSFNNNTYGIQNTDSIKKCLFSRCNFNDNLAYGFMSDSNSQTCMWNDCTFNNNGIGIDLFASYTHTGFIIKNCCANNNSNGLGFDINNGIGGIISHCTAKSNGNTSLNGECAGIRLADCSSCLLEHCICSSNTNTSDSSGCFGILLRETSQNNQILHCSTDGNTNHGATSSVAAGIIIDDNVLNTVIRNCSSYSNKANQSYGIFNDNSDGTYPTIITGCRTGNNGVNYGGAKPAKYASRNELGSHGEVGSLENTALETVGKNEVGCVTYLDSSAFPLVITTPGQYIMCEDVSAQVDETAVTIQCPYVTFDMNNKQISGTIYDIAITVTSNNHDVVIKNGTISSKFIKYGIFIDNNCHHVDIENMNISNPLGQEECISAITFNGGTTPNEIHDCTIKNCRITSITPNILPRNIVVDFVNCFDIHILNSNFNFNGGTNTTIINLENAKKLKFIDCTFNDAEISDAATIMHLDEADGLFIDKCTFNNNNGVNDTYVITGTTSGSIIRNSSFMNNTSTDADLTIVDIEGGQGNFIDSCLINSNVAASTVIGILLASGKNTVQQCTLLSNSATDTAYGIQVAANYNTITECAIYNNAGLTGIGIQIDPLIENTLVKGCLSFNNTTTGINNEGTDSIIIGCKTGNNTPDFYGADALDFNKTGSQEPAAVGTYDNVMFNS